MKPLKSKDNSATGKTFSILNGSINYEAAQVENTDKSVFGRFTSFTRHSCAV